jgi:hypothetical protein
MGQAGKRPKLRLFPFEPVIRARGGTHEDDFAVYVSYRIAGGGSFFGTLKVIRKTDGRLIFPFDGAPTLGPYSTKEDALEAATTLGTQIVEGDLKNPEL